MKRILFLVGGVGLGNSTRCHSVISQMDLSRFQIDVATSGNGIPYFSNVSEVQKIFEFKGLRYPSYQGRLNAYMAILSFPKLFIHFLKNMALLFQILRHNDYSAVVMDSEYAALMLKPLIHVPLIALNNADLIVEKFQSFKQPPKKMAFQLFIEKFDRWLHFKIPDQVMTPSLIPSKNSFSWLVRPGIRQTVSPAIPKKVLVCLSGSDLKISRHFFSDISEFENLHFDVLGLEGISQKNITYHGKLWDNRDFLNSADILVLNAGFSSISEGLALKKPMILIPIPGHAEQYVNSMIIHELGFGLTATEENIKHQMTELLKNYQIFAKKHKDFNIATDGAEKAAYFIQEHTL